MNGRGHALAGSRDTATPILMKACTAVTTASPAPASWAKGSRAAAETQQQPHRQDAEQQGNQGTKQETELLARHREYEIGMGVRNPVLDGAGAGADAGEAAMRKGFQRQAGLIAGIGFN